jgi:hypothetical protein
MSWEGAGPRPQLSSGMNSQEIERSPLVFDPAIPLCEVTRVPSHLGRTQQASGRDWKGPVFLLATSAPLGGQADQRR